MGQTTSWVLQLVDCGKPGLVLLVAELLIGHTAWYHEICLPADLILPRALNAPGFVLLGVQFLLLMPAVRQQCCLLAYLFLLHVLVDSAGAALLAPLQIW